MKKIRFTLLAVIAVFSSMLGVHHDAFAELRTMKLNILSCLCSDATVRIALQRVEGVKEVLWNPVSRSAIITFDDERTNFEQIKDTLLRERASVVGQPEFLK